MIVADVILAVLTALLIMLNADHLPAPISVDDWGHKIGTWIKLMGKDADRDSKPTFESGICRKQLNKTAETSLTWFEMWTYFRIVSGLYFHVKKYANATAVSAHAIVWDTCKAKKQNWNKNKTSSSAVGWNANKCLFSFSCAIISSEDWLLITIRYRQSCKWTMCLHRLDTLATDRMNVVNRGPAYMCLPVKIVGGRLTRNRGEIDDVMMLQRLSIHPLPNSR